jgi:hypothetical protein
LRFISLALLMGMGLAACGPSYPKGNIENSVQELFAKELKAPIITRLVGRTLYVAFSIDGLMKPNLELSETVVEKLEAAMISISRIALSTDAGVDYTVIQARDQSLGVEIRIVRKMQDLKDLFYMRISKPDFDDRMVLEINRPDEEVRKSSSSNDGVWLESLSNFWYDISMEEFMVLQTASRINASLRKNPFLAVILGVDQVRSSWNPKERSVHLRADIFWNSSSTTTVVQSEALLLKTILDPLKELEDKYWKTARADALKAEDEKLAARYSGAWAQSLELEDWQGNKVLSLSFEHWREKNSQDFVKHSKLKNRKTKGG